MKDRFIVALPLFHSIQGLGINVGKNVVFIRLMGCSLSCPECDTKYSWDGSIPSELLKFTDIYEYINTNKVNGIVITGGLPLLYQDLLTDFFFGLLRYTKILLSDVLIETNGTLPLGGIIYDHYKHLKFNISPKLSSFYPDTSQSIIISSLQQYMYGHHMFKFVVSSEDDLIEIKLLQQILGIQNSNIYLMPLCTTRLVQLEKQEQVINMCLLNGYNYSPRLHVIVWNNKKGV